MNEESGCLGEEYDYLSGEIDFLRSELSGCESVNQVALREIEFLRNEIVNLKASIDGIADCLEVSIDSDDPMDAMIDTVRSLRELT